MAEKEVKAIQTLAVSTIIKSLGDISMEKFTCGGSLYTPSQVQLVYRGKDELWSEATFPGVTATDLGKIIKSSTFASFGKGKETVTDKNYRDAYALEPKHFLSSFQLSDSGILGEVCACLCPDNLNIRAELYKMNIYTAPAGHFKSHVDTPRTENMFGSLVVCLPTQFAGRALVTRHNGQVVTYNWSSSPADNSKMAIQWAAFFSDVEHEILPVTEGCRVTLTYNLYHCGAINPALDVSISPFYTNLKAALNHPHFLREGGILGFMCKHAYVYGEPERTESAFEVSPQAFMKGSDRIVMLAAKSLGLFVKVRPIVSDKDEEEEELYYNCGFNLSDQSWWWMIGHNPQDCNPQEQNWKMFFKAGDDYEEASGITWCEEFKPTQPAFVSPHYGNEFSTDTCYMAAAILVYIPAWSERCEEGTAN